MIPWRRWFAFAVHSLGLAPEEFWALTVCEWRALAPDDAPALTRAGLVALIASYPDKTP
ncbi:MAG: phage tail assembly chaperone [Parvularculaceae bacterium]|nr:phage tail assembly chaperone [Parvularculaceae bacterium]